MKPSYALFGFAALVLTAGCAADSNLDRINREQSATVKSLNSELKRVNAELDKLMASRSGFEKAKASLETKMEKEMADGNLSVDLEPRGLVVTVLDRILYEPGRADLMPSAIATIDKLAQILREPELAQNVIYIEGHTDNQPIQMSAWRSNWELSTARATEVVHYFAEQAQIEPRRLAATGYGEFQPVADNSTPEGRAGNRRVEIVISPKKVAE